jgi:Lamin Tail Domain
VATEDPNDTSRGAGPITPDDRAFLEGVREENVWMRSVLCTLARRGVAFRRRHPDRAGMLLDALASWPMYKAGQYVFDLLELEDFMLDGDEPALVQTTLDRVALHRVAGLVRSLHRYVDGAVGPQEPTPEQSPLAPPNGTPDPDLPPLEAGFYLYQDVVLGIVLSSEPPGVAGLQTDAVPPPEPLADTDATPQADTPPEDADPTPTTEVTDADPSPPPAAAGAEGEPSSDVFIGHIHFKGGVKRTQSDEYVEISCGASTAVDIAGWVINAGNRGQNFTFPAGTTLAPGQTIRVYTDEIHPDTGGFSYGSRRAIWNDRGDTATLRDTVGAVVSQVTYGDKQPRKP